jgi:N6-L-threonylcarbamoyladenine synthase
MEAILPVIQRALDDAGVSIRDIEGIAATRGPGLVGSLLVGLSAAKAMACAARLPFAGVNHIEGHIAAIFLADKKPSFPFVALVVSGGHTHIYRAGGVGDFQILGQTRDDAAGEAFDKAARMLNLGYPGGVVIDRLAKSGNPAAVRFPRAMKGSIDFSFSGLKTSLLNHVKGRGEAISSDEMPDLVASYQEAIVDALVEKTFMAAKDASIPRVVVCGGVASNSRLRERFFAEGKVAGIEIFIPQPVFCTDNAAMIAVVGDHLLRAGRHDSLDLNAVSRWPLN